MIHALVKGFYTAVSELKDQRQKQQLCLDTNKYLYGGRTEGKSGAPCERERYRIDGNDK
jgi:hypothetical protein